ncbi:MAG: hypothetical protein JXB49_36010 [Bacteroidales bacterium]|nr:hypothetical protein [Bacteroidales bacterium]
MKFINNQQQQNIAKLASSGLAGSSGILYSSDSFWKSLKDTGTEIWLDTGDMEEARKLWTKEMSALTTNNTLLNNEIQKGIYDNFIIEVNASLSDIPLELRVAEIAFILNARHGLRLFHEFGGKVSVELHTNTAHDFEAIIHYGKRFHEICPNSFIIKVPFTPTGLLGARELRKMGVPINFTLGFSARQNALITKVAKPDYVNVFLGRLNAYLANNILGNGRNVGERATLASQKIVRKIARDNPWRTRQIAASLRSADQLDALAGVDVFTIPAQVAKDGYDTLDPEFSYKVDEVYEIELNAEVDRSEVMIKKLWDVEQKVLDFAESLDKDLPLSGVEIIKRAKDFGCQDMFPVLSDEDWHLISTDGKIPKHKRWAARVKAGELAIDTLLNQAGLASFIHDQTALDNRIKSLIS